MSHTEHDARTASTPKTRIFATLSNLLRGQGSSAPSPNATAIAASSFVRDLADRLRTPRFAILSGALIALSALSATPAAAAGCPNEALRAQQVYALNLPDCRAYEQVSPIDKNGVDAAGAAFATQASPSGEGIYYFALIPFSGGEGAASIPTYLSTRSLTPAWSTQGLLPKADPGPNDDIRGLTEDLTKTILIAGEPPLAPGATPGTRNAYVRDNATGTFQLLAPGISFHELAFVDAASADSPILFETTAALPTSNVSPASGFTNLYEWDQSKPLGERVSLAGLVPPPGESACDGLSQPACQAPTEGSVGGPGGPLVPGYSPTGKPGGSIDHFYTQNTISSDGSRVFFSDSETGRVYERLPQTEETVQVSGPGPAYFRAATPSGRFVFYTEGEDLYRFDTETEGPAALTSGSPGVQGLLGVSDDGSTAYLAATADLTGAEQNEWGLKPKKRQTRSISTAGTKTR